MAINPFTFGGKISRDKFKEKTTFKSTFKETASVYGTALVASELFTTFLLSSPLPHRLSRLYRPVATGGMEGHCPP